LDAAGRLLGAVPDPTPKRKVRKNLDA